MKIAVFGNKGSTRALLEHLASNGFQANCLITLSEDAKLRHQISGADNGLEEYCASTNIDCYHSSDYGLSYNADQHFFSKAGFDVGLSYGWQRLIPLQVLSDFRNGVFGWHGSAFEFPNGRGRSPINWSIRLGASQIFHNCFRYSDEADAGALFETKQFEFGPSEDVIDVLQLAKRHVFGSSVRLLDAIERKTLRLTPQPVGAFTTLPKLSESDGWLQLSVMTLRQAINITRSCSSPFPGAFLTIDGLKVLRIWKMKPAGEGPRLAASKLSVSDAGTVLIGFNDGVGEVIELDILSEGLLLQPGCVYAMD